ncbi:hypothetical protein O6H91_05G081700 [Diphasiastrum complanatum]|uniref:Uncharacterized protein n=1 Tax=Diphasiastrum complanatum TaxID=34168 RepID=A0ACC2DQC0_DIPCM|nr:hypothetical protein O6H91_05G081700 [Diphasiastrum complanatum]
MGFDRNRSIKVAGGVPREDGRSLQYMEFWKKYMWSNKPVVLTGLMDDWRACKEWVTEAGTPDLSFLSQNFGSSIVQVADCGERDATDQKRQEMTVLQYLQYWESRIESESLVAKTTAEHPLLYLKDWHFVEEYPKYGAYTTPSFFSDDCLNEYLDYNPLHIDYEAKPGKECSDYRFVYMGPKGRASRETNWKLFWSYTDMFPRIHSVRDVLRSYSWSANVCGRKCWHLLPPEQTQFLYDRFNRSTVYDIYADVSQKQFPRFAQTSWIECIQEKGEILFVPSGWYHQVTNTVDTLSINHNWLNACNLHWTWRLLTDDYKETVASIEDIREISDNFEYLCQRNLAANSAVLSQRMKICYLMLGDPVNEPTCKGMNFGDFCEFIAHMTRTSIDVLVAARAEASHGQSLCPVRDNQHLFNLLSIQRVARDMSSREFFLMDRQVITCFCLNELYYNIMGVHNITFRQFRGINSSSNSAEAMGSKIEENKGQSIAQGAIITWSQSALSQVQKSASTTGRDELESKHDFNCLQTYYSSPSQIDENRTCSSNMLSMNTKHKALTTGVFLKGREFFVCLSSPYCILVAIQFILDLWEYIPADSVLPEDVQIDANYHI